ncbi:transmembrane protein 132D-like [Salvelinus fontinalis]|uniref:transmembrane protein 132D-like n=1 Tax=Salvelinus fontinalis TaxID=8038 RepID=UPI0024860944|nr:transmembrane protein 132D-like [Salvelinus fontinalis]
MLYLPLFWMLPIVTVLIFKLLTGVHCQELSKDSKNQAPFPVYPSVGYQILNADYLLLREYSQELLGNSSLQAQRQAFLITNPGAGLLQPAVNATFGSLSVERPIGPELLLGSRRILPVILARQVLSSAPIIRILFHMPSMASGGDAGGGRAGEGVEVGSGGRKGTEEGAHCVTTYAFCETQEVRGACLLSPGGFCVAQLKPDPAWFSPASRSSSSDSRDRQGEVQGIPVEIYFQSRLDWTGQCVPQDSLQHVGVGRDGPVGSGIPMRRVGSVNILKAPPGNPTFLRLRLGGAVVVQTSSKPLRTTDMATFYVFLSSVSAVESFTLRATVRKGMSFSTARPSDSAVWDIALEPGRRGINTISVVCQRKTTNPRKRGLLEVLQLDFESKELTEQPLESQMITWRLETGHIKDVGIMRIYTTQRDYVGLTPLVMDSDVLNTAVLTGKKVSAPVRTLAVEADGTVTDVTNYTNCRSTDENVLKVSDRCDYVFVNGKETRGRMRMVLNFTYSYLSAQLEMSVWMPHLPLLIDIANPELSQIKGWRVPVAAGNKRTSWDSEEEEEMRKSRGCMLQYQHTVVRVLTPFVAESSDPSPDPMVGGLGGSLETFLGPDWQVDVTSLVRYSLRVGDQSIARLHAGTVLQGRSAGTTTLQVMSPLSDSILAERMVRVLEDKVSVTELGVQLVSGLSLSLQLSPGRNMAIIATATIQEVMQRPKQEAMVSCWIQFSDGSVTPLDLFDRSVYSLTVTSGDKSVGTVRRTPQSAFVVAEGEGQGALVKAELRICEECQKSKRKSKLVVGNGLLRVTFQKGSRTDGGVTGGGATGYGSEGSESEVEPEPVVTSPQELTPVVTSLRALTEGDGDRRSFRSTVPDCQDSTVTDVTTSTARDQEVAGGGISTIREGISSTTTNTDSSTTTKGKPGTDKPQVSGRPGRDRNLGRGQGLRRDWGNLVENPNQKKKMPKAEVPPQKEQPKPPQVVESDLVKTFKAMSDLEIGIFALVGVSVLAILAFLLNCASYNLCFRVDKITVQGNPDPNGPKEHRHDWVWLGTSTGPAPDNPPQVSTIKRENHGSIESHCILQRQCSTDSHRALESNLSMSAIPERTATLGRRSSSQQVPTLDPMAQGSATLLAKPTRSDPLHSPTSKRNQVQFTTFTTLDIKHLAVLKRNGVDFNWASQSGGAGEPKGPLPDMLWPVVTPMGQPQ